MDFAEADRRFRRLREQYQRGMLNDGIFEAEVHRIVVEDDKGTQWMIGIRSGTWYYLDGSGGWKLGVPGGCERNGTQCPQCGRDVDCGVGVCDECIAKAVTQTRSYEEGRGVEAERDRTFSHRNGVTYLALTVLALMVACAFLFSFQATASQWMSPASTAEQTVPAAVALVETEHWPTPVWPTPPSKTTSVQQALASPTALSTAVRRPAVAVPLSSGSPTTRPTPIPVLFDAGLGLPLSGSLIYSLFDDTRGTFNVFSTRIKPGGETELLASEASQPDVNARGQLAYRSWNSSSRGILMSDPGDDEARRLVSYSEAARPGWSYNGDLLLFHSLQESDRKSRIYMATPAGDFEVAKWNDSTIFGESVAWLPDGRFVTKSCQEGRCGIYIIGFSGARPFQLTTDTSDMVPEPSPDGRRIAFMSHREGNWEVYVVDVDGQHLVRLTSDLGNDGLPTWSPDGRHLAFVSNRNNEWAIWASTPEGGEQRRLLTLGGTIDGRVRSAQSYESRGWIDERICWIP